jgi:peptidoglycan-associated lipoprotein
MRKNYWIALALVLILPAMLLTVSCAKKEVAATPEVTAPPEKPMEDTSKADAEAAAKAKMQEEQMKAQEAERAKMAAQEAFVNEDIYFEFDSSALMPAAQEILSKKADYLLSATGSNVTIQGNCDERGTEAYNLALGERRAEAAKAFLVNLGVDASRITTISYGEERPLDPAHNEEAWAKNRRDNFVLN